MRPNLSVEKIAGALAVLGAGVMMYACGGDKPANAPVNSTEAPAAADATKPAADGHCGAGKEHKPGEASCGGKPADATSAAATPAASASAASTAASTATAPAASASAAATDAKPDKPGKKGGGKKAGGSSCGAGTCSAKK